MHPGSTASPHHVVVIADGDVPARAALDAAWPGWDADVAEVIAADGGFARARAVGLRPTLLVGDLDSLAPGLVEEATAAGVDVRRAPVGKDESDTELALLAAVERGATRITVLGAFGGAIVGLVLGLVNAFKKEPSRALILGYAAAEGLFLGGISAIFGAMYEGIVLQAVLGTTATFVAALFLYKSGTVRVTPKLTRFFLIAIVGYALFSLVNVVLMLTGASDDAWGLRTGVEIMGIPLGVFLGVFAVGLAALSLIMDFDAIKRGVDAGVPARFAWSAAFGLAVTLVWLYIEFLRLLAILRSGD